LSDAKQGFADALEMNPDDKAAKLYIDRCKFSLKSRTPIAGTAFR